MRRVKHKLTRVALLCSKAQPVLKSKAFLFDITQLRKITQPSQPTNHSEAGGRVFIGEEPHRTKPRPDILQNNIITLIFFNLRLNQASVKGGTYLP